MDHDTLTADPGMATPPDTREELAGRLFDALVGAFELCTVHLGRETGLYDQLATGAPRTCAELVRATGLDPRYVQAWLDQQAAAGLVEVDDPAGPTQDRRHWLTPSAAEVLLDDTSPYHLGPAGPFVVSVGRATPAVLQAFRTGGGVPYADFGEEIRTGIAAFNRPMFEGDLASSWLPAAGDVNERLSTTVTPRILDLGMGTGRSSVELARAHPHATVRGIDLDSASVEDSRALAADLGLADRVTFSVADSRTFDPDERFDLITIFESLHDTADPVATLANARRLLAPGGQVLIGDDRGDAVVSAPADPYERLLHGFGVLHCIPATRAEGQVHAHGPVVRPQDALGWIRAAGFGQGEVLDITNDMWGFYLATP